METKKWSTKKKVLVSILVILCAAIIAGVLYMFFKPDPLPQVSTAKVTKGSITAEGELCPDRRHKSPDCQRQGRRVCQKG